MLSLSHELTAISHNMSSSQYLSSQQLTDYIYLFSLHLPHYLLSLSPYPRLTVSLAQSIPPYLTMSLSFTDRRMNMKCQLEHPFAVSREPGVVWVLHAKQLLHVSRNVHKESKRRNNRLTCMYKEVFVSLLWSLDVTYYMNSSCTHNSHVISRFLLLYSC